MSAEMHKVVPEKMHSFKEDSKTRIYPTFSLDSDDLPELKNWKVGNRYVLVMEVEQMSVSQGKDWQGDTDTDDNKVRATFKIMEVGVKKEAFEEEYARKRSSK